MEFQKQSLVDRWGVDACKIGWVGIPSVLLFAQSDLKISSTEMVVLLHLLLHWWDKNSKPYPSQAAVAHRSGLSPKTVQRALHQLEKNKLIAITNTARSNTRTRGRNYYDLTPLVEKLSDISPIIEERLNQKRNK